MRPNARGRATYDDVIAAPEHVVAELIDGELFTSPRPGAPHARFASALGMDVGTAYDRGRGGPGGWWILFEPELHFQENVLVPDLAGWRRERMPELPKDHIFSIVPDWICEVTSPSSGRLDRLKKMPIYLREGVAWAWIVDPDQQMLEVFRGEPNGWRLAATHGENEVVRIEPFDAIEIDLGSIWGPPPA